MKPAAATACPVAYWATERPDAIALRRDGGGITWAEWHDRIALIEQQLIGAGIGEGARVGLCLPTGVPLLSLLIALFRRGAVACPVSPQFPVAYRARLLGRLACALVIGDDHPIVGGDWDAGSDGLRQGRGFTPPTPPQAGGTLSVDVALITLEASSELEKGMDLVVPPACGGAGGVNPTASEIPPACGGAGEVNTTGSEIPPACGGAGGVNPTGSDIPLACGGVVEVNTTASAIPPACGGVVEVNTTASEIPPACGGAGGVKPQGEQTPTWSLDAPATIIFTSGSTGEPKAAVLSLRNHLESARAANANIPLGQDDRWLLSLPMHHVAGFGVLFRCLLAGATVSLPASGASLSASTKNVTHVSLVARQLAQLLDADAARNHLKAILLGGSAIPGPLVERARAAGAPIHTSYGMTETATQIAATPPGATRGQLATSGRPLVAGTIRIGGDGRVQVNGPARFLGYWSGDGLSCPFDDEGWFTTSDRGYFDDDGFLHITGRADNVFIAGGENVQPEEIERVLCALPGVSQAVVVPVDHPDFGATPVAFVEGADGREEEMGAALAKALPRFSQPRYYFPWPTHLDGAGMKIQRATFAQLATALVSARRADP